MEHNISTRIYFQWPGPSLRRQTYGCHKGRALLLICCPQQCRLLSTAGWCWLLRLPYCLLSGPSSASRLASSLSAISCDNSLKRLFCKSHATCRSNMSWKALLLAVSKTKRQKLRLNIVRKCGWHQTADALIGCGEGSEKFTLSFPVTEGCWFCRVLLS